MKILITGGCGYIGSLLIPELLKEGHKITNIDTQWFGNFLKKDKNLKNIKCDIRNIPDKYFKNIKAIIHLANIANDPTAELMPNLSWEVNVLGSYKIINQAKKNKIKKFIFGSSGSVYGVKKEKKVHEELSLKPISTYNKTKMIAERVFLSYKKDIIVNIIRPATVCGVSPRMRLDISVNLLTYAACKKKNITVLGGNQVRPNIHIKDMVRVYKFFLKKNYKSGFYNAGFENTKIIDIAKKIKSKINSKISIKPSNDPRSYRQDSSKLLNLGFVPKYSIDNAIEDLIDFYKNFKFSNRNLSVKWLKKNKIK
tara:strand:+ start:1339 stop:2271 length:933 start_codon:yes stop_codon:yes gene_type:complete